MTPDGSRSSNPFATRHIRPGAQDYLFPPDAATDLPAVVARLVRHDHWGQIIGPHGTGKSTLLARIVEDLRRAGRHVELVELHDGERQLPIDLASLASRRGPLTVAVDGYEQLGCLARRRLQRMCRRRRWGLLVTSHADAGLPLLYATSVAPALAERIVARLLPVGAAPIDAVQLAVLLSRHGGNLREVLFELYDQWEERS